jgi:hypothetical protein
MQCMYDCTTAPEADKISSGVQGHTALDFAYVNADGTEGQAVIEGKTVSTRIHCS